jgi:hypothetical protein
MKCERVVASDVWYVFFVLEKCLRAKSVQYSIGRWDVPFRSFFDMAK